MIGATLGGLTLLEEIGRGATSIVYRASDVAGTVRAVKVYKRHLFETGSRAREKAIEREARLREERIAHPNVCRVHGWGRGEYRGERIRFLVSEFISGASLERIIAQRGA
ncbi:MAG TPA: hypothetical protein VNA89_16210, partial [Gemmatimonadaceae bacterium]|nr:hypothetical protein [Gemmatimonadaceae bacterium]